MHEIKLDDIFQNSIDISMNCQSENSKIHPKVGAILVKDNEIIAQAYRGENDPGAHAEYILLDKKLKNIDISGAILFTTLEPCTKRSETKTPCTDRIIARRIKKVYIGILDPNKSIDGKGVSKLQNNDIEVEFYPKTYREKIRSLNAEFIRLQGKKDIKILDDVSEEYIDTNSTRSLDDWYQIINKIYWNKNYHTDSSIIFTHLVEVIGGLSSLATKKDKGKINFEDYIVKAITWWFTLCGKLGVKSVEQMIWYKFPGVCPYCQKEIHDNNICLAQKEKFPGPRWKDLAEIGEKSDRPERISDWVKMFAKIYPVDQNADEGKVFARLTEELGELAEAIRVFQSEPGYFLSEASDIFAWLMHIYLLIERGKNIWGNNQGFLLETLFCMSFPDRCPYCGKEQCICAPLLESTIGRIGHEVPLIRTRFDKQGDFLNPPEIKRIFSTS